MKPICSLRVKIKTTCYIFAQKIDNMKYSASWLTGIKNARGKVNWLRKREGICWK